MIAKLTDALAMFWQALDERERLIVLYAGIVLLLLVERAARADRERRLVDRVRRELIVEVPHA